MSSERLNVETLVIQSEFVLAHGEASSRFHDVVRVLSAFETDSGNPLRVILWGSDPIREDLRGIVENVVAAKPGKSKSAALRSLLTDLAEPVETVAVVVEGSAWKDAGEAYGVETIAMNSDPTSVGGLELAGVPLEVARRFFPNRLDNMKHALEFMMQLHGGELVSDPQTGPAGIVANAKIPVALDDKRLGNLDGVHVDLPVTVDVPRESDGVPRFIPQPEAQAEAVQFIHGLQAAGRIHQTGDPEAGGHTHTVTTDEQGRRRLIRERYS